MWVCLTTMMPAEPIYGPVCFTLLLEPSCRPLKQDTDDQSEENTTTGIAPIDMTLVTIMSALPTSDIP